MSFEPNLPDFSFRLSDGTELPVIRFRATEVISRPFRFDLVLGEAHRVAVVAGIIGQQAALILRVPDGEPRVVRGVVLGVDALGPVANGEHALRARLVPRLRLLKARVTSRIFQSKTVSEIVDAVLDAGGIPRRWTLAGNYKRRQYTVQYEESDLAFIERLLADAGIFYSFEHVPHDGDRVVFSDSKDLYPPIAGDCRLAFRSGDGSHGLAPKEHHVQRFTLSLALRSAAILRRDYDFSRPTLELRAQAGAAPRGATSSSAGAGKLLPEQLTVYEHAGRYDAPEIDDDLAQVGLEQIRRSAAVARGESGCRRLVPGSTFVLEDHEIVSLNGDYVVTRVEHTAVTAEYAHENESVYKSRFECVPATVPYRPKRRRHPVRQVVETATVVGPRSEEIHADDHGRIKVQFHWDLDGKHNERSSCWIRVAQPWAGSGFGFQFVPRVGMEVLVTFVGGDPARPIVTGCIYNGHNRPPYALPGESTKSGIRTRTSPAGGKQNEIVFEDKRDAEELGVHASRDLAIDAGGDASIAIVRDHEVRVGRNLDERVGGCRRTRVAGHEEVHVEGDRHLLTGGGAAHEVRGGLVEDVDGSVSTKVGRDYTLHVAGNVGIVVGKADEDGPNHHSLFVYGDHVASATDAVKIRAEKKLTLTCGDSMIELSPDCVRIEGKSLKFSGAESVSITGKGPALVLDKAAEIRAKELRLFSSEAQLILDEDARLNGKLVRLNCNDEKSFGKSDDKAAETRPLRMKLTDAEFEPYANKRFHVIADGMRIEGTTDAEGMVDKPVPKDAKSIALVLWIGEYPTSEQKTWTITGGEMPEATTLNGAQMRLRNLGYYHGDPSGKLDDATKAALSAFQEEAGLPANGQLDAATAAKLGAVHGR